MSPTRRLCERIARRLLERRILGRDGESLYLSRFYLLGRPHSEGLGSAFDERDHPTNSTRWSRLPVSVFLHKFHRGDDAGELHNHPWKWAFSIVLAGGYREERRARDCARSIVSIGAKHSACVYSRTLRPLSMNVLHADDYHRVDLLERDCWSLFVAGPRAQSWGFWDRRTGKFTPWREFVGLPPAA